MFSSKSVAILLTVFLIVAAVACGGGSGTSAVPSSSSSGGSWQKVNVPSGASQVNYVAFNGSDHWFIADRNQGFYRSTDQGASWTPINSGIATKLGWTINVNPVNGDLIASTFSGGALNANPVNFYLSTDEGSSWSVIPSGHLSSVTALTGCVFAANSNVVCGGYWAPSPSSGAWVSTNGGLTFFLQRW